MKKAILFLSAAVCLRPAFANNINVPPGGALQAALNAAQPGDTITLAAGATYIGHFYLPPNGGSQWVTIQSSAMSTLPGPGNRVSPAQAAAMPKVLSPDGAPALAIAAGANYYRIQGIEFGTTAGIYALDVIQAGTGSETSNSQLPHDLDFDRDYIHGDPAVGSKRGIALNGINITVENCYFSAFTSTWQDTQALAGWNGPGPYNIVNNYLEAGTEIVAFGGSNVSIYGNIPSDITIRSNTFFKPLSWRPGDPSYAGVPVWAKNHIELKNAQRVTIDSNTFTNNWIGADQQGYTFVFSVRTESGNVPWATVSNVTVKNNVIRHSAAGASFIGHDGGSNAGSGGNFTIQNNVWEDISGSWGGDGRLFTILNATNGATFDRNTAFQTGYIAVFDLGASNSINFTNNIFNLGGGVVGNSQRAGIPTLNTYAGGGTFADNLLIGTTGDQYPANTFFASSIAQVGFVNYNAENFLLAPNSPYRGMATDGGDLGSTVQTTTQSSGGPSIPSGWVNIISKISGLCLADPASIPTPGTQITQWACNGYSDQKWQLTPVSGGYEITNQKSGLQLDIRGGPAFTQNGVPLIQWPYWGGTNEIFRATATPDGYYTLSPVSSNLCVDVPTSPSTNGGRTPGLGIQQWACWGGDMQKWSLVPVP